MATYPLHDDLKTACRHCATLSYYPWEADSLAGRGFVPEPDAPTATVTFLEINGANFALTADHVVCQFKKHAKSKGQPEPMYIVPAGGGTVLHAPFLTVPTLPGYHPRDIAIMPIAADVPERVGKSAFRIFDAPCPPFPLKHALACGYPRYEKRDIVIEGKARLAMQCVHAIAEGKTTHDAADQVQFLSDIEKAPNTKSLSGMSGGPVFWSEEERYGLLGLVHEALDVTPTPGEPTLYDGPRVNFIAHRATYDELQSWANFATAEWPKARDALNAWAKAQGA